MALISGTPCLIVNDAHALYEAGLDYISGNNQYTQQSKVNRWGSSGPAAGIAGGFPGLWQPHRPV